MKKRVLATLSVISLIPLVGCGKETVYIVSEAPATTEATVPDTTVARATTTSNPQSFRPPASNYQEVPNYYDPEQYDTFLWESENDFWWLFTKEQLLAMGLLVCEAFDDGYTLDEVTEELISAMINTGTSDLMEGLAAVTAGAVTFLCPEHSWWMDTI